MMEFGYAVVLMLLGAMLFFPIVVAPVVFTALPEAEAGRFLRALFPRYYLFMISLSLIAFGVFQGVAGASIDATASVCLLVALTTVWVRQSLVPRINDARDSQLAGDASAGQRFDRDHKVSVAINMVQLVALVAIFAL